MVTCHHKKLNQVIISQCMFTSSSHSFSSSTNSLRSWSVFELQPVLPSTPRIVDFNGLGGGECADSRGKSPDYTKPAIEVYVQGNFAKPQDFSILNNISDSANAKRLPDMPLWAQNFSSISGSITYGISITSLGPPLCRRQHYSSRAFRCMYIPIRLLSVATFNLTNLRLTN
jgi:hypothetical protein